ncbi:ribonuclease III [Bacteroidota bacterium]
MLKIIWQEINKNKEDKNLSNVLKKILGKKPDNLNIYKTAFLHKSCSKIKEDGEAVNNERLEYLGDAILGAVIADYLFHLYPRKDEGFLTKMRSRIVNGDHLGELANKIGLDQLMITKTSSVNHIKHIYGDVFEAFIGAVFYDKGYKFTRNFIISNIINKYIDLNKLELIDSNFKSQLIELCQKYKKQIDFQTNPESQNSKKFVSYVKIEDSIFGTGSGDSKKEAEQNAAQLTLNEINLN